MKYLNKIRLILFIIGDIGVFFIINTLIGTADCVRTKVMTSLFSFTEVYSKHIVSVTVRTPTNSTDIIKSRAPTMIVTFHLFI